MSKVKSYPQKQFITNSQNLSTLKIKIDNGQIKLNDTQFQRNNVHSRNWQEQLIQSLFEIKNILPPIYLALNEDGTENVIDGKQRLTAIYQFMSNKFSIKDSNNKSKNLYYKDFDDKTKSLFDTYLLDLKTIENLQPEEQIEIFDRINKSCAISSGERLNSLKILNGFYYEIEKFLDNPKYEKEFYLLRQNVSMGMKFKKDKNGNKIIIDKYRFSVEEYVCQLVQYLTKPYGEFKKSDFTNTYKFFKEQDLILLKNGDQSDKQQLSLNQFNDIMNSIIQILKILVEKQETIKYKQSQQDKRLHIGKYSFLFPLCYLYHYWDCDEDTKYDVFIEEIKQYQNYYNTDSNLIINNKEGLEQFMEYMREELSGYSEFSLNIEKQYNNNKNKLQIEEECVSEQDDNKSIYSESDEDN